MDTFDEFLDKAKNLVDIAGKKTGEAVEFAKLKLSQVQINGEIQKTNEKLGAFVYKLKRSGDENDELIETCMSEIDGLLAQLDVIDQKINEIRSTIKCQECGAVNDNEASYCAKCGAKIEVPVQEEAPDYASADEPFEATEQAEAEVEAAVEEVKAAEAEVKAAEDKFKF